MKRVTLNIDLEDNELFEREVTKAVRDYAKQIAREVVEQTVSEEIERIAENSLKNRFSSGYTLERMIDEEIKKRINSYWASTAIKNDAFNVIQKKISDAANEAVQRFDIKKIFDDKLLASIREYFTGGNDGTAV